MADLKDYFYNLSSHPYIEIKKFIYEYTNKYVPSLLTELNTEFILCYTNEMEEQNSWKKSKAPDLIGNLFEDINDSTNILIRNYKYSGGIFEIEEIKLQYEKLNYSEHKKMSRIIHPFQFCMHTIIEEENSKLIKENIINYETNVPDIAKNEIKPNPYPLLFINRKVYECFTDYVKNHIIIIYQDFSYLKKRLEHEKLIYRQTDKDFIDILFNEMKLISEKSYNELKIKEKLDSLKRTSTPERENKFNIIFEDLLE